jgi:hypothetical protein
MKQLVRVSCGNNNLTSLDVSGCDRLFGLSSKSAGLSSLNISDCAALMVLDCEDNYLAIADILTDINIIISREGSHVNYINQRLLYDFTVTTPGLTCDAISKKIILSTVQFSATGTLPASVFIEVNKLTASAGTEVI